MATATYSDYLTRHPGSTATQATVEAFIEDAAAEIAARCEDRGTTYEKLAQNREGILRDVECSYAFRACGRPSVDGISQEGLQSFSQKVGDHQWDRVYTTVSGGCSVMDSEWRKLGLIGQQAGWLGIPWSE